MIGNRELDFAALYKEHHSAVRGVLFRFGVKDLEDAVQDVFLKAYRGREFYRRNSSVKTWILSIAINYAKDFKKKRELLVLKDELPEFPAEPEATPLAATLEACLESLAMSYREVLILCAIEGYTMAEASSILNVPEGTVKSRLFQARSLMKDALSLEGIKL